MEDPLLNIRISSRLKKKTWLPWVILVVISQLNKSSLNPFGQIVIDRNLATRTYGRLCIKLPLLLQIRKQTWPPWEMFVSYWLNVFYFLFWKYKAQWIVILCDWWWGCSQQIFLILCRLAALVLSIAYINQVIDAGSWGPLA